MKILDIKNTVFPEIKIIRYHRFCDDRGYFTESFRNQDFQTHPDLKILRGIRLWQTNESYSKKGVLRGLHFQWNPYMGKLVRPIRGHMIDLFLDIRKGSLTYGKAAGYQMYASQEQKENEWIWIPVGFAHGCLFLEETIIEYFCTGEYSPNNEVGISPLASDIDWSLCEKNLKNKINVSLKNEILSDKDKQGLTIGQWSSDLRSNNFIFGKLPVY